MTQNMQANDSTAILSGYTSKLVSVTPTTVMMLASHPISLLLFLKKVNYLSHGKTTQTSFSVLLIVLA